MLHRLLQQSTRSLSRVNTTALKFNTQYNRAFSLSRTVFADAKSICHDGVLKAEKTPTVSEHIINVTFVDVEGNRKTVPGLIGQSILDVASEHNIPLYSDPTCLGELSCTQCHVIISNEYYDYLTQPTDDECSTLEVAFGLSENSRLACQVLLKKELDGMVIALPQMPETSTQIDSFFRM